MGAPFLYLNAANASAREGALSIWFTEPLGLATQVEGQARMTIEMAELLAGPVTSRLLARYDASPVPMRFIHDWRGLSSYDPKARQRLIEWGIFLGRDRVESVEILLSHKSPRFVRMGVAVGEAMLAAVGVRMRVSFQIQEFEKKNLTRVRPVDWGEDG